MGHYYLLMAIPTIVLILLSPWAQPYDSDEDLPENNNCSQIHDDILATVEVMETEIEQIKICDVIRRDSFKLMGTTIEDIAHPTLTLNKNCFTVVIPTHQAGRITTVLIHPALALTRSVYTIRQGILRIFLSSLADNTNVECTPVTEDSYLVSSYRLSGFQKPVLLRMRSAWFLLLPDRDVNLYVYRTSTDEPLLFRYAFGIVAFIPYPAPSTCVPIQMEKDNVVLPSVALIAHSSFPASPTILRHGSLYLYLFARNIVSTLTRCWIHYMYNANPIALLGDGFLRIIFPANPWLKLPGISSSYLSPFAVAHTADTPRSFFYPCQFVNQIEVASLHEDIIVLVPPMYADFECQIFVDNVARHQVHVIDELILLVMPIPYSLPSIESAIPYELYISTAIVEPFIITLQESESHPMIFVPSSFIPRDDPKLFDVIYSSYPAGFEQPFIIAEDQRVTAVFPAEVCRFGVEFCCAFTKYYTGSVKARGEELKDNGPPILLRKDARGLAIAVPKAIVPKEIQVCTGKPESMALLDMSAIRNRASLILLGPRIWTQFGTRLPMITPKRNLPSRCDGRHD